jgi:hypothetical protein
MDNQLVRGFPLPGCAEGEYLAVDLNAAGARMHDAAPRALSEKAFVDPVHGNQVYGAHEAPRTRRVVVSRLGYRSRSGQHRTG